MESETLPPGWSTRQATARLAFGGACAAVEFVRGDRGQAIQADALAALADLVTTPLVERMRSSPRLRRLHSVRQAEQAAAGAVVAAEQRLAAAEADGGADHGTDLSAIQAALDGADAARAAVDTAKARLARVRQMAADAARDARNEMEDVRRRLLSEATASVAREGASLFAELAAVAAPILDRLVTHRIVAESVGYGVAGVVDVEQLARELPAADDAPTPAPIAEATSV